MYINKWYISGLEPFDNFLWILCKTVKIVLKISKVDKIAIKMKKYQIFWKIALKFRF